MSNLLVAALGCSAWASAATAAEIRLGVNAEVSYKEDEAELRRRYAPFLEELGQLSGHKILFFPVYSDRVEQAVAERRFDLLLIHTHLALKAAREAQFQVLAFTDDRKNNKVYFFVRSDSAIKDLPATSACAMGVPGMQSWATATARGTFKTMALPAPRLVATRYQDAVPIMLEVNEACVGVTRSKGLVDDYVAQKKVRVLHVTQPIPLNALAASSTLPPAVVDDIRTAMARMARSKAFESTAFKGLHFSTDELARLDTFFK